MSVHGVGREKNRRGIAIDLCCGLGGWTIGLLEEGWNVIGFDIVTPKTFPPGAQFVLQDVGTIDARSWRGKVGLVVASPPCTEFSQMWRIARHRTPDPERGMATVHHCFRIALESGAEFVIENVYGAIPHFAPHYGEPSWHIGPYYFWGDAPVLKPQGVFHKRIWSTAKNKDGVRRWKLGNRASTYERNVAERARIPREIARTVGNQLGRSSIGEREARCEFA